MEIYQLLTESSQELYPEDLDFFETELATNNEYSYAYRIKCKGKIDELRNWMSGDTGKTAEKDSKKPKTEKKRNPFAAALKRKTEPTDSDTQETRSGIVVGIHNIAPEEANPMAANMTPAEQIKSEIDAIRLEKNYRPLFKQYVIDCKMLDQAFLEENFCYFTQVERDVVFALKPLDEAFLEKYFDAINPEVIARYKLFSESFYIKHFSQLDPELVLKRGKNEWRKKENRSKQLDVFLRLKGIDY